MPSTSNPPQTDIWIDAWSFASQAHREQKVSGSDLPYLTHLGKVTLELLAAHAQLPLEDINLGVVCAILHDCVEDQSIQVEALRNKFGSEVAAGVAALSKNPSLPKEQAMLDSLARIRQQPKTIWCVKLADRITNLAPPPAHWSDAKITAYRAEAALILKELGPAHQYLAARLQQKIAEYASGLS
jgi:GTP diphosphokinase / guanosine-3',5'-bis(diphosphate) 3'-diphosphatase